MTLPLARSLVIQRDGPSVIRRLVRLLWVWWLSHSPSSCHQAACSNAGRQHDMAKRTGLLCEEIKQAFYLAPNNGPIAVNSNILTELIRITKVWIEKIVKFNPPTTDDNNMYSQRQLAMLLCLLDDVDADNLQFMQSQCSVVMSKRKRPVKSQLFNFQINLGNDEGDFHLISNRLT